MKANSLIFTSLVFLFTLSVSERLYSKPRTTPTECSTELTHEIDTRKETLSKINNSLDTLIGEGNSFEVPLTLIFQVDIQNQKQIEKRVQELSGLQLAENIGALQEYEKYKICQTTSFKKKLNEVYELQAQVNIKKLAFLSFDSDKRNTLSSAYDTHRIQFDGLLDVQNQITNTQKNLADTQTELAKTETAATDPQMAEIESIIVARSTALKFLTEIEIEHLEFLNKIQNKKNNLDRQQADLAEASKKIDATNKNIVSQYYSTISNIWENAADQLLDLFSSLTLESKAKIPEQLPTDNKSNDLRIKATEEYIKSYNEAKNKEAENLKIRTKLMNNLKVQNFRVLQESGQLRAKLLQICDSLNCERARGLNQKNIELLVREIKVVPLRFISGTLSKWLEVKSKFSSGLDGWLDITRQVFILIILFLIPVFLVKTLRWTSIQLEGLKKHILSRSMMNYRKRTQIAVWITRVNPFIPALGMILSIQIARIFIQNTDLKILAAVLYYFQIYYVYRVLKILMMISLEIVFTTDTVSSIKEQKLRITKSATRVTRLIFIEYLLLHITQDTVRKALAYHLFSNFIFWINVVVVVFELRQWHNEIYSSFKYRFPKSNEKTRTLIETKFGKVLLPIMFILIVANDLIHFVSKKLTRVDFIKRILSDVLRKRLESVEKEVQIYNSPSADYLASFDYYLPAQDDIYVERDQSIVLKATESIENWLNNKSPHDLLVIVGNRGVGKSTTLDHIYRNIGSKNTALLQKVPTKITKKSEVFKWLTDTLNISINSTEDIKNYDKQLTEKRIICIDDIQNLFLGIIGGFEAYRTFLEIISLKTLNIYWCLTVNSRSWAYLNGILGKEHFYGQVMNLTPWTESEIQRLILVRHRRTNYERIFDKSIKAYGAGDSLGQQAETQFFRLLWGQARGNPRSALMYWVSAISSPETKKIHVGIPSFISPSLVETMSEDALFMFSAIARHESLTPQELKLITDIDDMVIRKCIQEALDKQLIWIDVTERVRISSRAQYVIDYYLIGKNFLYE